MAFFAAMDAQLPTHTVGENNSLELSAEGVGQPRVALFAALVRNCPNDRITALVDAVVKERSETVQNLVDLIVLTMQTRDCRGGKGERDLSQRLFWELLALWPDVAIKLIPLLPEYGSYRDLPALWHAVSNPDAETAPPAKARGQGRLREVKNALEDVYVEQLRKDLTSDQPSLAAKYAPREKKQFAAFGAAVASKLFPGGNAKAEYRKAMARLTSKLDVPEVKMCGKRWAEIDVSAVPSRCLAKSRRGFLNEKLARDRPLTVDEDRTGDRFPDDEDRVTCRQHVREAVLASSKIKGKQCFPHELVRRVIGGRHASTLEDDLVNAQWATMKKDIEEQIAATGSKRGALTALVDVSGSMAGVPMEVSIALGLLVSDLADEPFKHRVLTFESTPRWHKIPATSSPVEQIRNLQRAPWGGSTNFAAAMDLLLAACVDGHVQAEDVPDLIVFSDMQFDAANGPGWETHHERLTRVWAEKGYELPTITYWNLRGDTQGGFMADSKTPGVRLLSGFSPALLKLVLTGEEADEDEEVTVDGVSRAKPTPYETMRRALDAPRYDAVRAMLSEFDGAPFADYTFTPAPEDYVVVDAPPPPSRTPSEASALLAPAYHFL